MKLLYVAATRALHELAVVHTGDLTDLIGTKVSEEKRLHSLENQVHKESQALRKKPALWRKSQLIRQRRRFLQQKSGAFW